MKRNIFIIFIAALSAVSCLKNGGFESTYQLVATFDGFSESWDENYYDGEFYGDDKAYFEGASITEDNFVFFNCVYNEDMKDFTGFGLSMATAKDEEYGGRFSVNADEASSGNVFALFHNNPEIKSDSGELQSDYHIFFATTEGTCTPVSCMVNNTKLVADRIAEYNAAHEVPVEVTLTATGYLNGAVTGSAEILLAGPAGSLDDDDEDDSETKSDQDPAEAPDIMSKWTKFDLSKLGYIEYITFSLSFSDESQTEIPEYFCMDSFVANIHIAIEAE